MVRRLVSLDGGGALRLPYGQGVRRSAANTGPLGAFDRTLGRRLTYADLTSHSGSSILSTPGATYYRKLFTAPPTIAADNITLRQCLVRVPNTSLYAIHWAPKSDGGVPRGLQMIDTEVDGQGTDWDGVTVDGSQPGTGNAPSAAIEPGIGYTARRCRFHSCGDLLKPQDNPEADPILVEDCRLDRPCFPRGAHADVLQVAGSGAYNVTVRRSTLIGLRVDVPGVARRYASSSLIQFGSFPPTDGGEPQGVLRNLLFEDLYVDGGTYAARLTIDKTGAIECTNVVFRRIRFGLAHEYGALTAPTPALDGQQPTVEDCVWDATGVSDSGLAVIAGQPVI